MNLSRRNFLVVSGLAGGGLVMSLALPLAGKSSAPVTGKAVKLNTFLTINTDGKITFLLTKHEMGQGTGTGLPMIFLDELGGDWSKLEIKRADYDKAFDWQVMGTTGGSGSVMRIWNTLRQAGATAREMLKQAAANEWNVSAASLIAENSFVINPATGDKLEFGVLAEAASQLSVPENVVLKDHKDFVYIGKPVKNIITKDVVRGTSYFGIDVDLKDMVYAAVERCPVFLGKLVDYDDTEARKIEGVIDIIPIPYLIGVIEGEGGIAKSNHVQEGVAVIANSTWTAFKAKKLLKINWDYGEFGNSSMTTFSATLDEKSKTLPGPSFTYGDTAAISLDDHELLEVEYNNPHQAHALMEPLNATVHFRGDTCEVWVGNQDGGRITKEVANVVGLPEDSITTHVLNSGGSFGRRYFCDSSMEASYLSKQIGKPVKVTWTREDEIRHDYYHPYQRNYFKAMINKDKEVVGMENHIIKTIPYATGTSIWDQLYSFPNAKVSVTRLPAIIHQGAWRSVAEHSSTMGLECFIDEVAQKIGVDPLAYRLQLVNKPYPIDLGPEEDMEGWIRDWALPGRIKFFERAPVVLNHIKDNGLWDISLKPGQGKGLALGRFGLTVVAHIVIVNMNDTDYGFKVERVTSVVHCGQVVNPHFGTGQIEGAIIWALSALKYGGLEIENGKVLRSNFHDNRIVRMDDCPEIDVHFIESHDAPSGLGEPGTPPLAPAVLNAIFNASGKRIRKMPVRKEDIEHAL